MKNLTITLNEDTLSRIRIAAAKEGKSMSRFVAELVESRVGRAMSQREALEQFLAGPLIPFSDENGKIPSRAELYDDVVLSGHQPPALQPGPEQSDEAERGRGVDRPSRVAGRGRH